MRLSSRFARLIRHHLLLMACVSAAAGPAVAQEAVSATSGSPEVIARIRAQFAEIEREAPGYRRTTRDLHEFSLEGGELTGFYRGRELRKLHARLYGETWRGTEEYYFANGRLIFVHVVQERYDEPMSGRVQWTIQHRLYFDGGRLVRLVRNVRPDPRGEDLSAFDPDVRNLLRSARLFAACASAAGDDPPECTAPQDVPQ